MASVPDNDNKSNNNAINQRTNQSINRSIELEFLNNRIDFALGPNQAPKFNNQLSLVCGTAEIFSNRPFSYSENECGSKDIS